MGGVEWSEWCGWGGRCGRSGWSGHQDCLASVVPSQYTDMHNFRGSDQNFGSLPTLIFWGRGKWEPTYHTAKNMTVLKEALKELN